MDAVADDHCGDNGGVGVGDNGVVPDGGSLERQAHQVLHGRDAHRQGEVLQPDRRDIHWRDVPFGHSVLQACDDVGFMVLHLQFADCV